MSEEYPVMFQEEVDQCNALLAFRMTTRTKVMNALDRLADTGLEAVETGGLAATALAGEMIRLNQQALEHDQDGRIQPPFSSKQRRSIGRTVAYMNFLLGNHPAEQPQNGRTDINHMTSSVE